MTDTEGQKIWVVVDQNDTFLVNGNGEELFDYQEQLDADYDGDLYFTYVYPTEALAEEEAKKRNMQGWNGMKIIKVHWAANLDYESGDDWWEWNIL